MMIQRKPVEAAAAPAKDPYNPDGNPSLAASLDKGFPYDDWAICWGWLRKMVMYISPIQRSIGRNKMKIV